MTPMVAVWVLSLSGAGLFFLGGHMFSRVWLARANAHMFSSLSSELQATRAHLLEQEQTKQNLRTEQRALSSELSRSQAELHHMQSELVRAKRASNPLSKTSFELQQMETEITQLRHDCTEQARALTDAERAASQSQAELKRLTERITTLSERSETAKANRSLEKELETAKESLRARDAELSDLRATRDKLQGVESELAAAKRLVSRLTQEARSLRSDAFKASEPPPDATAQRRSKPVDSKAHVLQALVDAETGSGRAKTAVIADELGLLVAASGVTAEYAEPLAAMGAYLNDIGVKLQDMLPLCAVSQVIVRDDQALSLSMRPLPLDQPGLSLVTLGEDQDPKAAPELAL